MVLEFIYRKNSAGFICKSFDSLFGKDYVYENELEFDSGADIVGDRFINSDNTIEYSLQGECLEPNKIPIPKKSNYEIFYSLEREFQKISNKTSSFTEIDSFKAISFNFFTISSFEHNLSFPHSFFSFISFISFNSYSSIA